MILSVFSARLAFIKEFSEVKDPLAFVYTAIADHDSRALPTRERSATA
jgi:hypothetical protein